MRCSETSREIAIISNRWGWKLRLLVWLFPRQFNTFASSHLSRAKETSVINSFALHDIAHWVGASCCLPGYGAFPWYLKDKYGWPIEFQEGKGRVIRIIFQNIRKITG